MNKNRKKSLVNIFKENEEKIMGEFESRLAPPREELLGEINDCHKCGVDFPITTQNIETLKQLCSKCMKEDR